MATTCELTLSSDITSSEMNISASTVIKKAELNDDLELIEMGRGTIAESDGSKTAEFGLPTALGVDKAAKLFFVNKATDPTFYIDIDLHDTNVGRLYAGDWMFIPWSAEDADADIEIKSSTGTNKIVYMLFHEGRSLNAS